MRLDSGFIMSLNSGQAKTDEIILQAVFVEINHCLTYIFIL